MNKLSLKIKVSFILFAFFLILSAVLFNFEQIILAIIALALVTIFAGVLIVESKKIAARKNKNNHSNL